MWVLQENHRGSTNASNHQAGNSTEEQDVNKYEAKNRETYYTLGYDIEGKTLV